MSSPARPIISLPGSFAAVVMDLDGLLVETERLWSRAKAILFERHDTAFSEADHLAVLGTSDVFTAEYFTRRFELPLTDMPRIREEYMAVAGDLFESGTAACAGAPELVEHLAGRVPLAIASNTRRALVATILRATPFGDRFDAIVTGDDGAPKPAPDLYPLACERLGAEPASAVALEDSPTGVAAAKAAGLTCIGVPSHPDAHLTEADLVVDSLIELL